MTKRTREVEGVHTPAKGLLFLQVFSLYCLQNFCSVSSQLSHKHPNPFEFGFKVHQAQDSLVLYQRCDMWGWDCSLLSTTEPSCHILLHVKSLRWKWTFLCISTGCSPRKCWLNSHLGHISSEPITSPLIYLESNSLAEGQWNLQVLFLCLLMKWSWYPSSLQSLKIIYPNTQNTLIFLYWVLHKNLEAKANHT